MKIIYLRGSEDLAASVAFAAEEEPAPSQRIIQDILRRPAVPPEDAMSLLQICEDEAPQSASRSVQGVLLRQPVTSEDEIEFVLLGEEELEAPKIPGFSATVRVVYPPTDDPLEEITPPAYAVDEDLDPLGLLAQSRRIVYKTYLFEDEIFVVSAILADGRFLYAESIRAELYAESIDPTLYAQSLVATLYAEGLK